MTPEPRPLPGPELREHALRHLEHELHPWVAFLILPTFAFPNGGVSFENVGVGSLLEPVSLGILLGLVVGKQIGAFGPLRLCIRLGLAPMPAGANWAQLHGVSLVCGVDFTMSLFIGGVAFEAAGFDAPVRLGVLGGSLIAAIAGYTVLRFAPGATPEPQEAPAGRPAGAGRAD